MKTKLLIATIGLLCFAAAGCKSAGPNATFNTIATLEYAVDGSMKAYLDGVVKGQYPTNDVPKVMLLYDVFQASEHTAIAAANGNTNAPPTSNLTASSVGVLTAINAAKGGK